MLSIYQSGLSFILANAEVSLQNKIHMFFLQSKVRPTWSKNFHNNTRTFWNQLYKLYSHTLIYL